MTRLSPRLEKALEFTQGFHLLADIGTDHALLPIKAVLNKYVSRAIAIDNKQKPLENARKNILKAKLDQTITTVLSDGLTNVNEPCDLVAILGMGGNAIAAILDKANLQPVKRLILSPNSESSVVREWLEQHEFMIEDEYFLEDRHKTYQLIIAKPGRMTLTPIEREFGAIILKRRNTTIQDHLNQLIYQLQTALNKTRNQSEQAALNERIKTLKGLIR